MPGTSVGAAQGPEAVWFRACCTPASLTRTKVYRQMDIQLVSSFSTTLSVLG